MEHTDSYSEAELRAVNSMLRAISEAPVSSLDNPTIEEPLVAVNLLWEVSKDIQSEDWFFNSKAEAKLVPEESSNKIPLGSEVIHVEYLEPHRILMKRQGHLWDYTNQTWEFQAPVKVYMRYLVDYCDLPPNAERYIRARATRRFVLEMLGDMNLYKAWEFEEIMARAALDDEDARLSEATMLDTYFVRYGVMNRGTRYGGD